MRLLKIGIAVLFAQTLFAQNCFVPFELTATGASKFYDNSKEGGCTRWTVTYTSTGFSAISLLFESASDLSGSPATFVTFGGTTVSGSNPNTTTTSAYTTFTGMYAYTRVRLTAATGSGTVKGAFYGSRENAISIATTQSGGGGGGGTPGGLNKQIQYNNSSSFGGIAGTTIGDGAYTMVLNDTGAAQTMGIMSMNFAAADGQQNETLNIVPNYSGSGGLSTLSGVYVNRGVTPSTGTMTHVLDYVSNSSNASTSTAVTSLDSGYFAGWGKSGNSTVAQRDDFHSEGISVSAGTLSLYKGFGFGAPTKSGSGVITEAYGITVPAFTSATTNVGLMLGGNSGAGGGGAPNNVYVPLFVYPGSGTSYLDITDIGRKDVATTSGTYCQLCFGGLNRVTAATTGTDTMINGQLLAFAGSTTIANMVGMQLSVNPYLSTTTVTNNYGVKIDATVMNGGKAGRTIGFDATIGADGTVTGDTIGYKVENISSLTNATFTGNTAGLDIGTMTPSGSGVTFGGTAYNIRTSDSAATNLLRGIMRAPDLSNTSSAQTGTLCWATSTGNVTVDTTTTCLLSLEELKDKQGPINNALSTVMKLKPFWFRWKKDTPEYAGDKAVQPGLGAHQVASVDKRLAAYDVKGNLHGVRYQELTAVLVKAIQEQQAEIDELKILISKVTSSYPNSGMTISPVVRKF